MVALHGAWTTSSQHSMLPKDHMSAATVRLPWGTSKAVKKKESIILCTRWTLRMNEAVTRLRMGIIHAQGLQTIDVKICVIHAKQLHI